jgi:Zn-dependent protease
VWGARPEDFVRGLTLLVRLPDVFAHWRSWNEVLRVAPIETLARLAARLVSVNLLPLAPLAGGQVISRLMSERARGIFAMVSMSAMLLAMASGFFRSCGQ